MSPDHHPARSEPAPSHPRRTRWALLAIWLVAGAAVWAFVPTSGAALDAIPPQLDRVHDIASPTVAPSTGPTVTSRIEDSLGPARWGVASLPAVATAVLGLAAAGALLSGHSRDHERPPAAGIAAPWRRRGPPSPMLIAPPS